MSAEARAADRAACCLLESDMWIALPETRYALRVAGIDREAGLVRLQGADGTITVPGSEVARGILLIPVTVPLSARGTG